MRQRQRQRDRETERKTVKGACGYTVWGEREEEEGAKRWVTTQPDPGKG